MAGGGSGPVGRALRAARPGVGTGAGGGVAALPQRLAGSSAGGSGGAGTGLPAKAVLDIPTTRALVERLRTEGLLRRLCGWEAAGGVPSEATFSRAFAEFAASDLPGRLHEALLDRTLEGHLVGHVSRDSTAIPGRESPAPKPAPTAKPRHRRGRPRKDEPRRRRRAAWSSRRR